MALNEFNDKKALVEEVKKIINHKEGTNYTEQELDMLLMGLYDRLKGRFREELRFRQ